MRVGPSLLLLPALVFLAAVFLVPLVRLVVVSFVGHPDPFGHYVRAFGAEVYLRSIVNTVQISAIVSIACLVLAYPAAYILASARPLVRVVLAGMIIIPYFIAVLIRSYGWMVLLGTNGPLNWLLVNLGLTDEPIRLIFTRGAVLLAMTVVLLPMMILPIYSVMSRIDPGLMRAAQALGASPAAAYWRVYMPLTIPGALAGSLLVFILGLGFFITPTLVGGPTDRVIAMDIAAQAGQLTSEGFIEAVAVLLLVATLGILAIASRFVRLGQIWSIAEAGPSGDIRSPRRGSETRTIPALRERIGDRIGWPLLRAVGRLPSGFGILIARILTASALFLVVVSLGMVIMLSFSASPFLTFPPPDWSFRWYEEFAASPRWIRAATTSLMIGGLTAAFSLAIGTLAAIGLVRGAVPAKGLVVALLLSPMIVPSVVVALSLYWVYLTVGVNGTILGLVGAHALGALPLVVLIVAANLQTFDRRLELAAQSVGARPLQVLRHITLPLILPGMIVAGLFAFLHSFDELVLTLFVRGARISTLPIELWADLNFKLNPVLAVVSTLNVLVVMAVLGAVLGLQQLSRRLRAI